jgi:light-regulated signal transduction histidine kinase (bacteriophytochrome)
MLNYQATKQEWENSTKRNSKPLHALQGCLDLSPGTSADLIGTMNEIQSQLIPSTSIEALFGTIVGTASELTGHDRVMVY